jgi:hypothetical protein
MEYRQESSRCTGFNDELRDSMCLMMGRRTGRRGRVEGLAFLYAASGDKVRALSDTPVRYVCVCARAVVAVVSCSLGGGEVGVVGRVGSSATASDLPSGQKTPLREEPFWIWRPPTGRSPQALEPWERGGKARTRPPVVVVLAQRQMMGDDADEYWAGSAEASSTPDSLVPTQSKCI